MNIGFTIIISEWIANLLALGITMLVWCIVCFFCSLLISVFMKFIKNVYNKT